MSRAVAERRRELGQRLEQSQALLRNLSPLPEATRRRDELARRLTLSPAIFLEGRSTRSNALASLLQAYSPEGVLSRGYSITRRVRDGKVVTHPGQVVPQEGLEISLREGTLEATVGLPAKPKQSNLFEA